MYPNNDAMQILGCILNDPSILKKPQYRLDREDFVSRFHLILFGAMDCLVREGAETLDEVIIDMFLEKYPTQYEIFNDNHGMEFIITIKQIADPKNLDVYYGTFRKFSMLREFQRQGQDITEIYDEARNDEFQLAKLQETSIEELHNHFASKIVKIKSRFLYDDSTQEKRAGDNADEIIDRFKESPMMGLSFESKFLTTLWGGFRKKQLYIRSGDTSSGKSRTGIADLACICAKKLWNEELEQWVDNPNGTNNKGLYIGCEMELDEEVDPLVWAYISAIPSSSITEGNLTKEEEERVREAARIVNDDCMWLVDMPSFNIEKIEQKISEHKINHNIEYVCFDYMLLNAEMVQEFVKNRGGLGGGGREDQILLELSKSLKDICKKYDIALLTATQVNGDIADIKNRDYRVLRGGKAVADKATGGSISMPITQKELELVKDIVEGLKDRRGFGKHEYLEPNFVETVYKSRFGKLPKECKIFSYYDLGTMRKKEMFVTDKNFKLVECPKTIVNKL